MKLDGCRSNTLVALVFLICASSPFAHARSSKSECQFAISQTVVNRIEADQVVECGDKAAYKVDGDQKINSISLTVATSTLTMPTKSLTLSKLPASVAYLRNYKKADFWKSPGIANQLSNEGIDLKTIKSVVIDGFEPGQITMKMVVDKKGEVPVQRQPAPAQGSAS